MAKRLTRKQKLEFLVKLFRRPEEATESQVCLHFGISRQFGYKIKKQTITNPNDLLRLEELRNEYLAQKTPDDKDLRHCLELVFAKEARNRSRNAGIPLGWSVWLWLGRRDLRAAARRSGWFFGGAVAAVLLFAVFFWPAQPTVAVNQDLEKVGKALDEVKWVRYECQGSYWDGEIYWRRFEPEIFIRVEMDGSVLVVRQDPPLALRYDAVKKTMETLDFQETCYAYNVANIWDMMDKRVLRKFSDASDCRVSKKAQSITYSIDRPKGTYKLIIDAESFLPTEFIGPGFRYSFSYPKTGPVELLGMFGITNSR